VISELCKGLIVGIADRGISLIAPVGATVDEKRFLLVLCPATADEQAHDESDE